MFIRFFLKTIIICLLGCFGVQNAQANLLFLPEWNLSGDRNFYGNIVKIEEYIQGKLVTTYLFNEKSQLIETQFLKDKVPYSFRHYYNSNGKLETVELFNRKEQVAESCEKAIYNETGDIIAFNSYLGDKLVQKTSAVITNEAKQITMIVGQDKDNKISEFVFEYTKDGKLKQVRYSYDGRILNVATYSYLKNKVVLKIFNEYFKLKDIVHESLQFDSQKNLIKKIIKSNNSKTEITRKITYKKDKKKWFFGIF
jgi:hypothetical protein